jgi:RimJ/RimL family protein N-acetyltransferase
VIETERLILRRWEARDADPFFEMGQDPQVMRYLGPPMSRGASESMVAWQNATADATGSCFWAMERREDRAFLGFCGVQLGPDGTPIAGQPEIGWRLRRDAWGHGYALEAAEASIDYSWANTAVNHIVAITVHANTRSWGLMERLGMVRVVDGDFDHPGVPDGSPLKRHLTYRLARPA